MSRLMQNRWKTLVGIDVDQLFSLMSAVTMPDVSILGCATATNKNATRTPSDAPPTAVSSYPPIYTFSLLWTLIIQHKVHTTTTLVFKPRRLPNHPFSMVSQSPSLSPSCHSLASILFWGFSNSVQRTQPYDCLRPHIAILMGKCTSWLRSFFR